MKKKHKSSPHRQIKVVICGYYGRGSLGDEMILEAILRAIRSLSAKKCREGESFVLYIKILRSKNPVKVLRALARSDLFVFGGGSLLQNLTSNASLLYYLAVICVASRLSQRNIMLSNGIGPINEHSVIGKLCTLLLPSVLDRFDFISVRDHTSREYIEKLLPDREIAIISDPVLTSFGAEIDKKAECSACGEPYLVCVPCIKGLKRVCISEKRVSESLKLLSDLLGRKIKIAIFNEREDLRAAERIARQDGRFSVHIVKSRDEAVRLLGKAELVISQRYHATLLTLAAHTPVLSLSDDPKMTALCDELGAFRAVPTNTLSIPYELAGQAEKAIQAHTESREMSAKRLLRTEQEAKSGLSEILGKYIFENND